MVRLWCPDDSIVQIKNKFFTIFTFLISGYQCDKLKIKKTNAIPFGYAKDVFCAQNTKDDHSTCPGDSGK